MEAREPSQHGCIAPLTLSARERLPTRLQMITTALAAIVVATVWRLWPETSLATLIVGFWALFFSLAIWRFAAISLSRKRAAPPISQATALPAYTVVAALRHEALMIPQLVQRLARIDYPADRLQGFLALEADDAETIAAAQTCPRPDWLEVLVVPAGHPRTKPRALNHALARAVGDLITVYDAEDEPDPGQLREAAARFASSHPSLACVQAPLRIRKRPDSRSSFLDQQFALEYASLFEVMLPALARLGLPFPLGGTSNHFRVDVLHAIGGWDSWNVTEDADLGFRLWRHGWRLGVIHKPTWETPPGPIRLWLPQRTRWLKGFMQTWGVHMRAPLGLGWRGLLSLNLTLGAAVLAAAFHGMTAAWLGALILSAAVAGLNPAIPPVAWVVLISGAAAAMATAAAGARRAGIPWTWRDLALAPLYWTLLTQAFAHALYRLIRQPHTWDKTPHTPEARDADFDHEQTGRTAP